MHCHFLSNYLFPTVIVAVLRLLDNYAHFCCRPLLPRISLIMLGVLDPGWSNFNSCYQRYLYAAQLFY